MARAHEEQPEHETFDIYTSDNGFSPSVPTSGDDYEAEMGTNTIFDGTGEQQHSSSPATSPAAELDDGISEIPPGEQDDDVLLSSKSNSSAHRLQRRSPYTPTRSFQRRERGITAGQQQQSSPFRNPSSVKAMQMNMTPPLSPSRSSSSTTAAGRRHQQQQQQQQQRLSNMTTSRQSTPRSQQRVTKKVVVEREHPLVLLHVTLLPIVLPYPMEMMQTVLPGYIIENYNLLKDRVNETMFERGILLAHPREDYELLEERLLESLELKLPRILKCGHFHHQDDSHPDEGLKEDDHEMERCDELKEGEEICPDCNRRIHSKLGNGVGTGIRRWTIKTYAANGLMRAGAWQAAWKEMERVDVEIEPWIPEELRRELDAMKKEEEEEEDHNRREMDAEGEGFYSPNNTEQMHGPEDEFIPVPPTAMWTDQKQQRQRDADVVPLLTLLKNYLLILAKDKKNIAIVILGLMVVLLSINNNGSGAHSRDERVRSPLTDIIIPECRFGQGNHHHHQQQQQQKSISGDAVAAIAPTSAALAPRSSSTTTPEVAKVIRKNEEKEEEEGE